MTVNRRRIPFGSVTDPVAPVLAGPSRLAAEYPGFHVGQCATVYGPATYDRLVALKRSADPTNLFRFNQNTAP